MDPKTERQQELRTRLFVNRESPCNPPLGTTPASCQQAALHHAEELLAVRDEQVAELTAKIAELRNCMDEQRQQREIALWGTYDEKAHVIAQLTEANAGLNRTVDACCELLVSAASAMQPVVDAMQWGGVVLTTKNTLGSDLTNAVDKISVVLGSKL